MYDMANKTSLPPAGLPNLPPRAPRWAVALILAVAWCMVMAHTAAFVALGRNYLAPLIALAVVDGTVLAITALLLIGRRHVTEDQSAQ